MTLKEGISININNQQLFDRFSNLPDTLLNWVTNHYEEGIIVWNEENEICYASQSIKRMFGYEPEDLLGKHWYDYLNRSHVDTIQKYLEKETSEPGVFYLDIIHKDDSFISVEYVLSKINDEDSGETYIISYIRNLLQGKDLRDTIIQSEKMSIVGQLTASIAHEIRNPLTSIKGFLQLLQAGVDHKDEYYRIMLDEVAKMEAITSELLDIVKPVTNTKENESVYDMIRDVVTLLQSQAKMKNIVINIEKPITEIIYCNRSQLKQVLINLIKNAIEAMEEPGEITLFVSSDSTSVTIHVKDEGTGVPDEVANQLGEPFFTTKKDGTGLGLMITKQIVEQHGGTFGFTKNKDKGSTFYLSFPK